MVIFLSRSSFNFAAGAGLMINFIFFDEAMFATYSTVSIGVSNCMSTKDAFSIFSLASFISSISSAALAPGATTIQFSPLSSTVIRATPDG